MTKTTLQKGRSYVVVAAVRGEDDRDDLKKLLELDLEIHVQCVISAPVAQMQFIESNGEHPEKIGRDGSVRCKGTKDGRQCGRKTRSENGYCTFHKAKKKAVDLGFELLSSQERIGDLT